MNSLLQSLRLSRDVTELAGVASQDFAYEFVQKVPEDLICPVCSKVLCKPHQMSCCEQRLCKGCLEQKLAVNTSCPLCHNPDPSHLLVQQTDKRVGDLKVYCPNKHSGCNSTLKISEVKKHLYATDRRGCKYSPQGSNAHHDMAIVSCPFRDFGCTTKVCYKDLEVHCESSRLHHMNTLAKSHGSLLAEHEALRAEHKALQAEFRTLDSEHKALLTEHKALVKSFLLMDDQFKARVSVIMNRLTNNQFSVLSHVSTTTVDGPPVVLALSRLNVKNGKHYFVVSGRTLILEWAYRTEGGGDSMFFTLFLAQSEPGSLPASSFDIELQAGDTPSVQLTGKRCFTCCCLNLRTLDAKPLLGAFSVLVQRFREKVMVISFRSHQPRGCNCRCHGNVNGTHPDAIRLVGPYGSK